MGGAMAVGVRAIKRLGSGGVMDDLRVRLHAESRCPPIPSIPPITSISSISPIPSISSISSISSIPIPTPTPMFFLLNLLPNRSGKSGTEKRTCSSLSRSLGCK